MCFIIFHLIIYGFLCFFFHRDYNFFIRIHRKTKKKLSIRQCELIFVYVLCKGVSDRLN